MTDTDTTGTEHATLHAAAGTQHRHRWLPAGLLALVVVAGSASLFATYRDDAWHTNLGRDQA